MRGAVALPLAAALAVTLLGPVGPAHAGPATGPACGTTVSGRVTLTRDLVCTTGPGLVLTTGSTLDLDGHTLRGPGPDADAVGVLLDGEPSLATAVLDGTIEGWAAAVGVDGAELPRSAGSFTDVTFRGNEEGLGAVFSGSDYRVVRSHFVDNVRGISGYRGSFLTVTGSTFAGNEEGISSFGGGRIEVDRSVFRGNDLGLECDEQPMRVTDSSFVGNEVAAKGWWCTTAQIEGSTFSGNGTGWTSETNLSERGPLDLLRDNRFMVNGVAVHVREGTHLVGNTFVRNTTALLAEANPPGEMYPERFVLEENTFRRNRDAVLVPRAAASLRGNDAFRNSGQGIVAPNATDLGGNTARGNGVEPQCTGVTCGTGRVLDAATLSRRSTAPS